MAGMKLNDRIKASSLLETIVALLVVMTVFGIAMTIYINVLRNSDSLSTLKAIQTLEQVAAETKTKRSYFDESFRVDEIMVEKSFIQYQHNEDLWLMDLKAIDPLNKTIATRKEILITEEDE